MTIFIGDSESLRMRHRNQSRLLGLISIALNEKMRLHFSSLPVETALSAVSSVALAPTCQPF
ncbi:hypothetical protein AB4Y32_36265 [Paraburkholderia phymatum]|uniref:Uncharacterized protein n=1 Tax=Paraburkholderia phymatum TaxID=148447 RepID=A0ACC6UBX6_9BURK